MLSKNILSVKYPKNNSSTKNKPSFNYGSRYGNRKTNPSSTGFGMFSQKRDLHIRSLSEVALEKSEKAVIYELMNNKKSSQTMRQYSSTSFNQLYEQLKPNSLYFYVDKAVASSKFIDPGHVAFFLTDSKKEVILESCMSLRKSKQSIPGKTLAYELKTGLVHKTGISSVAKVDFVDVRTEFEEHFFKYAIDEKDSADDKRRFLIEVPLVATANTADEIVAMVQETQASLADEDYILIDGTVNDEQRKSLNCITGFYTALGVKGTTENPSPQMAAASVLHLILGDEKTNKLIEGTGLKQPGKERVGNDKLEELSSSLTTVKPSL